MGIANAVREEVNSLTLKLAVLLVLALCILCLTGAVCVLVRAQELHTQSVELFGLVYDWIEQNKDKEADHE